MRTEAPIFILSCGGRTGSTWLQRCLTATGEALVWGETGLLAALSAQARQLGWAPAEEPGRDLEAFRRQGPAMWGAHLCPEIADLERGWAALLEITLGETAQREGYDRWGCKEIDWDLRTRNFLLRTWPHARVIYLTRSFGATFASAMGSQWWMGEKSGQFVRDWLRMGDQVCFLTSAGLLTPAERFVRYEELVAGGVEPLIEWCGLPPCPREYVDLRIEPAKKRPLHESHRRLAEGFREQVQHTSEALGYTDVLDPAYWEQLGR